MNLDRKQNCEDRIDVYEENFVKFLINYIKFVH